MQCKDSEAMMDDISSFLKYMSFPLHSITFPLHITFPFLTWGLSIGTDQETSFSRVVISFFPGFIHSLLLIFHPHCS